MFISGRIRDGSSHIQRANQEESWRKRAVLKKLFPRGAFRRTLAGHVLAGWKNGCGKDWPLQNQSPPTQARVSRHTS